MLTDFIIGAVSIAASLAFLAYACMRMGDAGIRNLFVEGVGHGRDDVRTRR